MLEFMYHVSKQIDNFQNCGPREDFFDSSGFRRALQRFATFSFEHEMMEMIQSYGQNSEFITGLENSANVVEIYPRTSESNNVRKRPNFVKSFLAGVLFRKGSK